MRRYTILLAALCLGLMAWSGGPATAAVRGASGAALFGDEEVPGPGDPDGTGVATMRFDPDAGSVCYQLRVRDIAPATAAHIHRGAKGVAGPVVVSLTPPTSGRSSGCTDASPSLVQELIDDPDGFYVNVHNTAYPLGAVRGQLS